MTFVSGFGRLNEIEKKKKKKKKLVWTIFIFILFVNRFGQFLESQAKSPYLNFDVTEL